MMTTTTMEVQKAASGIKDSEGEVASPLGEKDDERDKDIVENDDALEENEEDSSKKRKCMIFAVQSLLKLQQ